MVHSLSPGKLFVRTTSFSGLDRRDNLLKHHRCPIKPLPGECPRVASIYPLYIFPAMGRWKSLIWPTGKIIRREFRMDNKSITSCAIAP
jgi:hypothetical protein